MEHPVERSNGYMINHRLACGLCLGVGRYHMKSRDYRRVPDIFEPRVRTQRIISPSCAARVLHAGQTQYIGRRGYVAESAIQRGICAVVTGQHSDLGGAGLQDRCASVAHIARGHSVSRSKVRPTRDLPRLRPAPASAPHGPAPEPRVYLRKMKQTGHSRWPVFCFVGFDDSRATSGVTHHDLWREVN